MKKSFFLIIFVIFSLTACTNISESTSSSSASSSISESTKTTSLETATETETLEYSSSSSPNVFEIDNSVARVTISSLSTGKIIYLSKTNPTSSEISSSYTRCVSSASGISLSEGDTTSSSSGNSGSAGSSGSHGQKHSCTSILLNTALPQIEESSSRNAVSSVSTVTVTAYTSDDIGSATRSIYVDQDEDISNFAQETATLRAVGQYCYVWVMSDNWTSSSTASGEKINSSIASKIADNFDSMYDKIRNVFGEESNCLAADTSLDFQIEMNSYSETGEMVNIIIYDIGKDYTDSSNSGSVVGYFYAKDYYYLSNPSSVYKYSNKGKYFYVDGYYAANYTSMVYSTLAHEFQHMIDFSVKSMENKKSSNTATNEMKSMLCEDIMFSTLCELDSSFSKDDSPVARLPVFNRRYAEVGLEYKSSNPEVYYSYANNYAFGAWLLRNYGGVTLLNEIATNSYVNISSILNALSTTGAAATTMEELLKEYTVACVISSEDSGFAKELSDSELTLNDITYSLESIDLWNLSTALPETYSECKNTTTYYKFDGPYFYAYDSQIELRPYGITLQKIGTTTDTEVTINFNTTSISSSQKMYLIIE
ncbi:hypothetical protein [Treponema sp.]|uniref:hypothetical protein n=1 Tax=Treponema sp. TaxID=166 RepID=UPI00388ED3AD